LAVGAELVRLEVAGEGSAEVAAIPHEAAHAPSPKAAPAPAPPPRMTTPPPAPKAPPAVAPAAPVARGSLGPPRPAGEKPIASPAVRRRAREAGIDLRQVRGSGPAGRISHDDFDAFLKSGPQAGPSAPGRVARTEVEVVKVIGMRRRIAQKMAEAKRRAAHFAYVEEVDVTALEELRARLNAENPERPRLTLMPFLMQAVVKGVADFPEMNALEADPAGQGTGTAIIEAAEALSASRGARRIGLAVEIDNDGARRLYERLGYTDWGHGRVIDRWTERGDNGEPIEEHADECFYLTKLLNGDDDTATGQDQGRGAGRPYASDRAVAGR